MKEKLSEIFPNNKLTFSPATITKMLKLLRIIFIYFFLLKSF